uniref:CDP-diacylglycerol--inositol 3-phosphatidyltransferase n=1 Tax=Neogobius melanostomus TaxID=47308 RepID=A0A8C6T5I7_9GOBI
NPGETDFSYARVVLALISFFLIALLDAFDGHAARALNQSTKFGAMMDMLTDRCATMCLLVNLSLLYPAYTFLFQVSMCLDISSHWLHLHSSTIKGSVSHKSIDLSGNPILRVYYTSKGTFTPVLFVMCAGNELFFCLLYLLHHIEEPAVCVSVTGWLYALLLVCALISLAKAAISVVHLVTASQNMAALDTAERQSAKKQ